MNPKLLRLTCANNNDSIFLNPLDITSIQTNYDYNLNNTFTISMGPHYQNTAYPSTKSNRRTLVCTRNGGQWLIKEHAEIVAALVEGRDPNPATILYGETSGNESKENKPT